MQPQLMQGAPPPADAQVTLANWRQAPSSRWGFRNVRALVPTAAVPAAEPDGVAPLPVDWRDIGDLDIPAADGGATRLAAFLRRNHVDGFVALRRGRLAYEFYDNGLDAGQQHILFSVSKSLTGALAGVLAERGLLDPDRPAADYVTELRGSVFGDARVRHLLDMTVAIEFNEDYADPAGDMPAYRRAVGWDPGGDAGGADLRGYLAGLTRRAARAHGAAFHYVSVATDTLGWVLERAGGLPFAVMLSEWIWKPMGAAREAWVTVDSFGAPRAAGGICVTARDLARFGEMMRRGGVASGRRIVPSWWVDDIRFNGDAQAWARGNFAAMGFPACRYRSKWYVFDAGTGAFGGAGIHGQWLYVCPENEVVIAVMSSHPVAADIPYATAFIGACRRVAAALGAG